MTVTDLKMNRFMMTLDQATSLLIGALKESQGGEIFILKMPVISLHDLVSVVVEETCKKQNMNIDEIEIQEIGLRPGEKMYEELMTYDESTMALELPDMFVIPSTYGEKNHYTQAKKATEGTYSSNDQKQISKEEVLALLKSQTLL